MKVPRFRVRLDIHAALEASGDFLDAWALSEAHPGTPLFSGGLLDSWPSWAVHALRICRSEANAVRAFHRIEAAKQQG